MSMALASRTDVGRVRTNNEDYLLANDDLGLYVMCDGMGGHNAGEVASALCCQVISREVAALRGLRARYAENTEPHDLQALRKGLENAVANACREIHRQASRSTDHAGMGTTCTVMYVLSEDKAVLGHVGDSRLYVRRGDTVHQLSEDHTYVNELVKRGALSREQARNHPQGNVLSRAMGVQPSVSVDTLIFDIDPGDTYMLCSDGVYTYLPDNRELATLLADDNLDSAVNRIVNLALERGGHDNCSAIILRAPGEVVPASPSVAADQRIAMLKKIPIFSYLTYNELVKVVGLTQQMRKPAGTEFIVEGQAGDELFVVLAGEVEVTRNGALLTRLGSGAHLGEMAMVDNAPRSATVRSLTEVNLLSMRREDFFTLIRTESVVATKLLWSFVKVLSGRLRETNSALQAKSGSPPDGDFEIFIED